jgi:hypothetical protein
VQMGRASPDTVLDRTRTAAFPARVPEGPSTLRPQRTQRTDSLILQQIRSSTTWQELQGIMTSAPSSPPPSADTSHRQQETHPLPSTQSGRRTLFDPDRGAPNAPSREIQSGDEIPAGSRSASEAPSSGGTGTGTGPLPRGVQILEQRTLKPSQLVTLLGRMKRMDKGRTFGDFGDSCRLEFIDQVGGGEGRGGAERRGGETGRGDGEGKW